MRCAINTFDGAFLLCYFARTTTGRSFDTNGYYPTSERGQLLRTMEQYMPRLLQVEDGHACMLRAICDVARTPHNADGILGDMFNLLLTPSYAIEQVSPYWGDDDFLQAQRQGKCQKQRLRFHNRQVIPTRG